MARTLLLLALGALLTGCAAPLVLDRDGALVVIPHQISDAGHILVDATVNGWGPYRFMLDTGASISVLYDKTRTWADVQPAADAQVNVLGMTGKGLFPVASSVQFGLGSETWNADRIALLPDSASSDSHIHGILGVDFLRRYAVHYSHTDKVLRLYSPDVVAERSYRDWHTIPMFEINVTEGDVDVFAFDIFIEGHEIPTIFDLGASVNIMNRRAARVLGVPARMTRRGTGVQGVTGEVKVLTELIVWRLRIAEVYWRHRIFLIGEFPIFDALDVSSRPFAIAGTDLFRGRDFIIDFERGRILVRTRD